MLLAKVDEEATKAKQSIDNATTNEAVDRLKLKALQLLQQFNLIPLKGRSETRN